PGLRVGCVGFGEEPGDAGCWLFLEDAGGEGYSPKSGEPRALAGRWLGLLHASGAASAAAGRQPDRGPDHYLGHLHSARATLLGSLTHPALTGEDVAVLREVVRQCAAVALPWGPAPPPSPALPP